MARSHFKRRSRQQVVEATLDDTEAGVLVQLCRDLAGVVSGEPGREAAGDPVVERLYPRAYLDPTEEQAESEWQRLVHDDLVTARRRALEVVELSLAKGEAERGRVRIELSVEEAEAWLSVLNDARLTLGIRLEVTEELDPMSVDPDDPLAAAYSVYWWLGLMEEDLVAALM